MNIRRLLAKTLTVIAVLILAGCSGKASPEYYAALGNSVTHLESLQLPAADKVAEANSEYKAALGKLKELNTALEQKLDPNASKTESYKAYEKVIGDVMTFTRSYGAYHMSTTVNETFDQKEVEKVVEDGKKALETDLAALKAAIAKEQGGG